MEVVEARRLGVVSHLHEVSRYRDWMPEILVPNSLPEARAHPVLVIVNQKGGTGNPGFRGYGPLISMPPSG